MPLIRVYSNPKDNPEGVDRLIFVENLPFDMVYQYVSGWEYSEEEMDEKGAPKRTFRPKVKSLKSPWEMDHEVNYPREFRKKYGMDETVYELLIDTGPDKRAERIVVPRKLFALKLDYQLAPAEALWKRIERLIEKETPRDREVVEAALVGTRTQWTLEIEELPEFKFASIEIVSPVGSPKAEEPAPEVKAVMPAKDADGCCGKIFSSKQALRMHKMRKHKAEPVGV